MKYIENRLMGRTGAYHDIEVRAQIVLLGSGRYRVQVSEKAKGRPAMVPRLAEGISDEQTAWGMLDVFVKGYEDAERGNDKSFYEPVSQLVMDD